MKFRPQIEILESRDCPTCTHEATILVASGPDSAHLSALADDAERMAEFRSAFADVVREMAGVPLQVNVLPAAPLTTTLDVELVHGDDGRYGVRWSWDGGQTWTEPVELSPMEPPLQPVIDWDIIAVDLQADAAATPDGLPWFDDLEIELADGTSGIITAVRADATSEPTWLFVAEDGTAAFKLDSVPAWMEQYVPPWAASQP